MYFPFKTEIGQFLLFPLLKLFFFFYPKVYEYLYSANASLINLQVLIILSMPHKECFGLMVVLGVAVV